ncbi:zinc-binding protein A33-like [Epinephelus moara]|uniref:zinc-binding protein A33-like n=1 Tax=Epinephelus moara TaxID=300413 RepID=UPI00214ECD1A|nr:zinc-binding protein A33-like [Epinephelus moara]
MTPSKQIKKLLKNHLDILTDEELREFQWHLADNETEGHEAILRSKLQKGTRENTVDRLVQVYGIDSAVDATVGIFFDMKQNDLARRLTQAIIEANEKQQPNEPSTSTVREMQRDANSTITKDLSCPTNHKPSINSTPKSLSVSNGGGNYFDPSAGHSNDLKSNQLQTPSRTIRLKREAFEKVKQFCDSSVEYIKRQRHDTEQKMRDDCEKLRHFLKTEEETRIAALEEEESQKIRMMQKITEISRDTVSLSDTVKEMEDLGADDSFIQNFKTEMERAQNALPDPQLLPQALIDVSEHVENLQFRVLETMLSTVKHTPVVLDPNTASPWLSLSDDLTKVIVTDTCQERPGNLECNSSYPHVLGWEGFDSGKHCWEMVVGNQTKWRLGVTERAKDRRDDEMCSTPQNGLYVIMKSKRGYTDVKGKLLTSATRSNKIRIELDYEKGTVSFYDADNNTLILTYEETFTQRLYPYFAFVNTDDDDNDEEVKRKRKKVDSSGGSIQICESKVSLTVT